MMPSIHDVQITVNAENCCNGCCFPFRKRGRAKTQPTDKKVAEVEKKVRRRSSSPT